MDDQIRLTAIGTQLSGIAATTKEQLGQMGILQQELIALRSSLRKQWAFLFIIQCMIGLIILLLLSAPVLAMYFGKAWITDLVRDAMQAEVRGQFSLIQYGYFSNNTKISDNPLTFDLKLAKPINLNSVVAVTAEPSAFIPGVSVETRLKDDKVCRIIFNGNTSSFQKLLEQGVQGKIIFTLKN